MTTPLMPDSPNKGRSQARLAKSEKSECDERPRRKPSASDTDADLIAATRSGDAAAYGLLYERHSAAARLLARRFVTALTDVDDVVAETFAKVLAAIRRGNGPIEAFRPYLLAAVRRVAIDLVNDRHRQIPTDDADLPDPGEPFVDPVVADLERSAITRAFWSLPERWSAVLWHTEVELARPAEVGKLLGLSANGVSVLKRRARDGLKLAYLQSHLADRVDSRCALTATELGRYVRGRLSRRQSGEVESHMARCPECAAACAELAAINDGLRGLLAPAVLGAAATGYLASVDHAAAYAAHAAPANSGAIPRRAAHAASSTRHVWQIGLRRLRPDVRHAADLIARHPIAALATAAAAASVAVPGLYLLHPAGGHRAAEFVLGLPHLNGANPAGRQPQGVRHGSGPTPPADPFPTAPATSSPTSPAPRTPSNSPSPTAAPTSPTTGPTAPTGTPTASPTAPPTATPPPIPIPTPTSTATPPPTPSPTPSGSAKLSVSVQVNGRLKSGLTALVTVTVSDPGAAATGPVTANIALPSGTTVVGSVGSSSWSCSATSEGQTCSLGVIGAGARSSLSFSLLVVNSTGCGGRVVVTATSGSLSATGRSATKVRCAHLTLIGDLYLIV